MDFAWLQPVAAKEEAPPCPERRSDPAGGPCPDPPKGWRDLIGAGSYACRLVHNAIDIIIMVSFSAPKMDGPPQGLRARGADFVQGCSARVRHHPRRRHSRTPRTQHQPDPTGADHRYDARPAVNKLLESEGKTVRAGTTVVLGVRLPLRPTPATLPGQAPGGTGCRQGAGRGATERHSTRPAGRARLHVCDAESGGN